MALAALIINAVWFALAFGLRTLIALRRTGDAGWRGSSARALSREWWAATVHGRFLPGVGRLTGR